MLYCLLTTSQLNDTDMIMVIYVLVRHELCLKIALNVNLLSLKVGGRATGSEIDTTFM